LASQECMVYSIQFMDAVPEQELRNPGAVFNTTQSHPGTSCYTSVPDAQKTNIKLSHPETSCYTVSHPETSCYQPTDQGVKSMGNKISVEEFINFGQTATLAYNLASHECEVDSSKQEILFNSLVSEKHIEGNLRMWDMAKFLSQECSDIPAARSRNITSEVEMRDSSVLGAAQDPYTMAGVYEIPEVIGDGAEDTQLDLGDTEEVLNDNVETADNEFTKEAEPPDVASVKPEVLLGLFSVLGCIVELAYRFGLTAA